MRQAKRDLEHARDDLKGGYFEWACFSAHQAAEKAAKAVFHHPHGEARGQPIRGLLKALMNRVAIPEQLHEAGIRLDRLYIPTRYANSFDSGAPADYFGKENARRAIGDAKGIVDFCQGRVPGSGENA
jgi:HEPN domain-containing protein